MRKIEKQIKEYFDNFKENKKNNNLIGVKTIILYQRNKIVLYADKIEFYLWDNLILWQSRNEKDIYYFSLRGWQSTTTLSRLKTFIPIYQKNYEVFVNNQKIDIYKIYSYNTNTEELKEL